MNPNEVPQQAGGINIDQMLQSLSTNVVVQSPVSELGKNSMSQPTNTNPIVEIPASGITEQVMSTTTETVETPSIVPTLEPSFSIDSLTKPLPSGEIPTVSQPAKKNLRLSHAAGMMASVFGTLAVVVIGGWVYSIQYPIATEDFVNSITNLFSSTTSTTQKNLQPDSLIVTATGQDEMHSAAPEDSYMLDTPLSDALLESQSGAQTPSSTEQMLDTVVGNNDQSTGYSSGGVPSTQGITMDLPSASMTSAEAKQKLLTLSQSAEEAMTNLVGNSDSKLALMRVIYKNSQSMLTDLMANDNKLDDKFIQQLNSLQGLYDKAIN